MLELLLTTYEFCYHFQLDDPLIQLVEDYKWINFFDFRWKLGIDRLSLGPVLLTRLITTLAAWPVTQDSRLFHFLMLAMYSGQIGSFSSRDLLLFFIMWELELIPVYLLLSMWGGKKRLYSATKFILYTAGACASITDTGLNGAILQIISDGFIGAALFFLAGTSYDRIRLVYLDEMGGVAIPMPKIFTMFSSFSMASLALPGMSGFVAGVLVFLGIITSQKYLLMPKIAITFVMAIGMILTPIYLLSMSRQIFYGYKLFNTPNSYVFDSGPRELFVSISIFISVIGIGMYLDFVLSLSVHKVEGILSNYFNR
ncbi:NAD(P)H-quinone oxidoreductase chain 4 [Helianthus annuus]|nr:NAD(P)H-quinone oxidoreductase chain 4 [Helianthus annuus]